MGLSVLEVLVTEYRIPQILVEPHRPDLGADDHVPASEGRDLPLRLPDDQRAQRTAAAIPGHSDPPYVSGGAVGSGTEAACRDRDIVVVEDDVDHAVDGVAELVLEALLLLEHRPADSCGIRGHDGRRLETEHGITESTG